MRKVTCAAISVFGALLSLPAVAEITPTATAQKPISNNLPQAPTTNMIPASALPLPDGRYQYVVSFNNFGPPTPPPPPAGYPPGTCINTSTVVTLTHNGDQVSFGNHFTGTFDGQGNINFSNGNPKVSLTGHLVGKNEITGTGMYPCSGGGGPPHAIEFDLKLVP